MRTGLMSGEDPGPVMLNGLLLALGGFLLLPGLIGDLPGLLCILPFARRWFLGGAGRQVQAEILRRRGAAATENRQPPSPGEPDFIEGQWERKDP